jgi:hypothetical protein
MAKAKTAAAPKPKKKTSKATRAVTLKAAPAGAKKKQGKKPKADGLDMLWKLAEHPLVGELLAIGATAAVAAIADQAGDKGKKHRSSKAVKAAGKAAAAAIGARLISEFAEGATKKAAKPAKA